MNSRGAFCFSNASAIISNVGPAAPFPEFITIFKGLSFATSMKLRTRSTYLCLASKAISTCLPVTLLSVQAASSAYFLII